MTPLIVLGIVLASVVRAYDTAPFAPGTSDQGPYNKCSTETHKKGNLAHPASMGDCLTIGEWARKNNGVWILSSTTTTSTTTTTALDAANKEDEDDDWHILRTEGNCSLVVKNTKPTQVGNKDVSDLIDVIHLGDGINLGSIEEKGVFGGCHAGADVMFWLRDSKFPMTR